MNETNRTAIVLLAALWIVLMAVAIFLAWSDAELAVDNLGDFVEYLDDHRDTASKLILTLGALVLIVLALLVIIVEMAPEEETREIRVEQAGATTIVPAEPLRERLEEALTAMPQVSAARARVFSQNKGVGLKLDLTITPDANIALVTQEASRVVVETLQADLGLPVAAPPSVRIVFGPPKTEPVASSVVQPPTPEMPPEPVAPSEPTPPGEPQPPMAAPPTDPAGDSPPGPALDTAAPDEERPLQPPPQAPPDAASGPSAEDPPQDETLQH
ncbi:MAG: hypothetical protein IIA23_01380 [Chloroflexi bacterium]|nr:hypothetical protein [Chloroflexota bacterium]